MAEQSGKEYIKEPKLPVRNHKGAAIRKLNFIVCLTGMPGSGKSTVAEFMRERGFSLVTMGDIVREEAKRSQIELTDSNLGRLMMKMRDKDGPGAIAQLIRKEIERIETKYSMNNFVVDGVRSLSEVEILRAVGSVKLLSIHASARVRFEHLKKRARDDAPLTSDDFEARDKRELSVGISEAIALSDEVLSNNSLTIGELKQKSMGLVQQWVKEHNNMYFPHTGEKS
jgi:dephospho-CoA kinase